MFIVFRLLYCAGFVIIAMAYHVAFDMPELSVEDATNIAFLFLFLAFAYVFAVRFIEMCYEDRMTESEDTFCEKEVVGMCYNDCKDCPHKNTNK